MLLMPMYDMLMERDLKKFRSGGFGENPRQIIESIGWANMGLDADAWHKHELMMDERHKLTDEARAAFDKYFSYLQIPRSERVKMAPPGKSVTIRILPPAEPSGYTIHRTKLDGTTEVTKYPPRFVHTEICKSTPIAAGMERGGPALGDAMKTYGDDEPTQPGTGPAQPEPPGFPYLGTGDAAGCHICGKPTHARIVRGPGDRSTVCLRCIHGELDMEIRSDNTLVKRPRVNG
jgi:hypothetical protein